METKIVQDFTLGWLKCTNIVKDIIAKCEKVVDNLQSSNKFSILIDERTDSRLKINVCVLIRYGSPVNKKSCDTIVRISFFRC